MTDTYDPLVVVLSVLIAVSASYAALVDGCSRSQ
jgi:NO-binding membrane sensor protein with MHYT domain